jgi:hypothetical protein
MNMDRIVDCLSIYNTQESLQANAHVWQDALAAIANSTMDVNATSTCYQVTLLHLACYHGKVDVVKQLLQLHANPSVETLYYRSRPMHYAAMSKSSNALEICRLLPAAEIAQTNKYGKTPLFAALHRITINKDLFQWMIQQPQYNVVANQAAIVRVLVLRGKETFIRMVDEEVAARKRWTPARAAWCAAACVCA